MINPTLRKFYSHVICSGTKIILGTIFHQRVFYSHVICSGTKILGVQDENASLFYSHVICSGTKISNHIIPRRLFSKYI